MNPKIILCLTLVLGGGLFGCKSVSDSRMDVQRQQLTNLYHDKSLPMAERVAAFDNLLDTFQRGTPSLVLEKYVVGGFETRLDGPDEPWWEWCMTAPDGSSRYIRLKGEDPTDQVVAY